jgi:ADP-ribose pyrophosphatase YjhB (NUDIX family)
MNILPLLNELRIIAQNGLEYTDDPHNQRRYGRLRELVEVYYGEALEMPPETVRDRLAEEFGHVTPKVGANAAVFDEQGQILLMKRTDDGTWCLPGGFVDPNESPRETAVRETREETGLDVRVVDLVALYTRKPGRHGPHNLVSPTYLCEVTDGDLELSHEGEALRYCEVDSVPNWHKDHQGRARDAYEQWQSYSRS